MVGKITYFFELGKFFNTAYASTSKKIRSGYGFYEMTNVEGGEGHSHQLKASERPNVCRIDD
jgi:hypothetical protein